MNVTQRKAHEIAEYARSQGLEVEQETSQYGNESIVIKTGHYYHGYIIVIVGQPLYAGRRPRVSATRHYVSCTKPTPILVRNIDLYIRMLAGKYSA